MVVHRTCSFCAGEIEPGTGQLFVKRDGSLYSFCSSSCRKQQMGLGRVGHRLRWTHAHELKRLAEQRRQPTVEAPAPSPAKGEGRKTKAAAPGPEKPKKSEPSAVPKKTAKSKPAAEAGPAPADAAGGSPKKPPAKKPAAPSDSP
jgi:large subunit ribosomal protein L24e